MVSSSAALVSQAAKVRVANRKRSKAAFDEIADIAIDNPLCPNGRLPMPKEPLRRREGGACLLTFLTEYFPSSTGLQPFGVDQIRAIQRMEVAILEGGWAANVIPRGYCKSTISENAAIWAAAYGYCDYILFFAGTSTLSEIGITSIKREFTTNELLLEDFPELCIPFIALEGKSQRANSQTYRGTLTNVIYTKDTLRLAYIPGQTKGCIIEGYGLLAPPRGTRYKNELGQNVRPRLGILDDISTDGSAISETQSDSRMRYIKNSISMMGGHGNEMSLICNSTVIAEGDPADMIAESDEWLSTRVAMVKKFPDKFEAMWLGKYATIRRTFDKEDPRGKVKAKIASTEYLKEHFEEMHEGSIVSWEYIGLEKHEISALQHAINIYIDKGAETFWAECQNKPLRPTSVAPYELTGDIAQRKSGYTKLTIPEATSFLTFGMDVHDNIIYYVVLATQSDFTGWIVDYGTFPEQKVSHFTLRTAKQTLAKHYGVKKADNERAIELGVEDLDYNLRNAMWTDQNGNTFHMDAGIVDQGYKREEVRNAIRKSGSMVTLAGRGVGIGPTKKPMQEYDLSPKRVIRYGPGPDNVRWILPRNEHEGHLFGIQYDANYWKSMTAARLVQRTRKGRYELFGGRKTDHSHFVSHLTAERPDLVSANGRSVLVWSLIGSQDNHWFDCLVMATVAANMAGARLPTFNESEPLVSQSAPLPPPVPPVNADFSSILACAR